MPNAPFRVKFTHAGRQTIIEYVDRLTPPVLGAYGVSFVAVDQPDGKKHPHRIQIKNNLRERMMLRTEIHEGLHIAAPELSEEQVCRIEEYLAPMLHAIGYRYVNRDNR